MGNKYLFLDFDGVLHSTNDNSQFLEKLNLLIPLVNEYSFNIIISSSWRFQFNLDNIKNFFPIIFHNRIIGMTGEPYIGQFARYNEIKNYLFDSDKSLADWRALDDTSFEFPKNCENLILCSPNHGLQPKQIKQLERWLEN